MVEAIFSKWFPFIAVGWIIFAIIVSAVIRVRRGKALFPQSPSNALFSERYCSGRSFSTIWARVGGARNCLLVTLTETTLAVTPHFPFNLIFLPEIYGLEHSIDISAIRDVTEKKGILGSSVTVAFTGLREQRFELRLRHQNDFLHALQKLSVLVISV